MTKYGPTPNKRESWEIVLLARDVLGAVEGCIAHHAKRRVWWTKEHEGAEIDIRERGVEFRDRQVSSGSYMEAVVDPELMQRMNLCASKIKEHSEHLTEYAAYRLALQTMLTQDADATVPLTYDDLRFFRYADVFPPSDDEDES